MGIIFVFVFVGVLVYLVVNYGEIDIFVKIFWGYGFL